MSKREIEEQAILAFNSATNRGFITPYVSESEIDDNAYEILGFMPDYVVDDLSDEEYDFAVGILKAQLF